MRLNARTHAADPALALTVGGVVVLALGRLRRSGLWTAVGLFSALAGCGLYARARFVERAERIDAAESRIRSELDELDPVARAQVLADVAKSQL